MNTASNWQVHKEMENKATFWEC